MNHRILIALTVVISLAVACSNEEQPADVAAEATPDTKVATKYISEQFIRDVMIEISSDEYEGRGPSTAGDTRLENILPT